LLSVTVIRLLEEGAADDAIPSLAPPEVVTHLWLIPVVAVWEGLRWKAPWGWAAYTQIEDDGTDRRMG
jgi:hypothetical protein